ncbi:beta-hydroxyacyl-ACP dehydratase [Plasmodium gaboni]|uniref:3-hydroxyacyl-[acyl-carrier-protein] dehydratase n=1 Tax=Plasmodium gaboni TaxID=647221 RepID=A0ABY1USS9_9APIC|nr:beta-hydroxyacyl-ACP dehydratase [Plasmodium gaboni]
MHSLIIHIALIVLPFVLAIDMKRENSFFLRHSPGILYKKADYNHMYDKIIKKQQNRIYDISSQINKDNINGQNISFNLTFPNYDTSIDIEDIKKILPHRYPFLLVDKVIYMQPNKTIIGLKQVSTNEPFFNGHFPQKQIMPGVLQIEALAQLAGILCLKSDDSQKNNLFLFAGVDGVRWKKPVLPGDTLTMQANLISFKSSLGIAKLSGVGYVNGKVAINISEMTFALSK